MKQLLTIISCFVVLSMSAQVEAFPFNPDADSDELITIEDLMTILSLFGQPFVMPDYSEWASGSMLNILAFQDSLADIASDLDALNDSLNDVQSELNELSDSLEQIVDFNSFISTQSPCHIYVWDLPHTYQIQDNCGFVIVTAQYGQTWPSNINDRAKIHLPQTGLFEGQKIFMFRTADYSDQTPFHVKHYVNGSWEVLTEIAEDNGSGNANWDSSLSNKVFTWNGDSWSYSTIVNYIISNEWQGL